MTGRHNFLSALGATLLGASLLASCASPPPTTTAKVAARGTPGNGGSTGAAGSNPQGAAGTTGAAGSNPQGAPVRRAKAAATGVAGSNPQGAAGTTGRGGHDGRRRLEPAGRGRDDGRSRLGRWFDGAAGSADGRGRRAELRDHAASGRDRGRRHLRLRRRLRRDDQAGRPDRLLVDLQQLRRSAEPDAGEAGGCDGGPDRRRAGWRLHEHGVPLVGDGTGQLRRLQREVPPATCRNTTSNWAMPYDVSAWDGITFRAKTGGGPTSQPVFVEVLTKETQPTTAGTVTATPPPDDDLYNNRGVIATVSSTDYQQFFVPFGAMIPRSMPAPVRAAPVRRRKTCRFARRRSSWRRTRWGSSSRSTARWTRRDS